MTLEESLLQRLVEEYKLKGKNLQGILDNPLFKDLPLDQKVKFVQNFKNNLSSDPKFNWSSVGSQGLKGAVLGAGAGFAAMMTAGATGGKVDPRILGVAAALGGLGGLARESHWQRKIYNNDVTTSKNLDDAIGTIIRRSMGTVSKPSEEPLAITAINRLFDPSQAQGYVAAHEFDKMNRLQKGNQ